MAIKKKTLTKAPDFPLFIKEGEESPYEFKGPLWTYAPGYEHWGPARLEDALYEAVYAPGSRTMWRLGQGAPLDMRTAIADMMGVLRKWERPGCPTCN